MQASAHVRIPCFIVCFVLAAIAVVSIPFGPKSHSTAAPTNDEEFKSFGEAPQAPVIHVAWSPQGDRILAILNPVIHGTGNALMLGLSGPVTCLPVEAGVTCGAFADNGDALVLADDQLWRITHSGPRQLPTGTGNRPGIVTASREGSIAVACEDGSLRVWDAAGNLRTKAVHSQTVHALRFSPDGTRLLAAERSGSIRILDAQTGKFQCRVSGEAAFLPVAWLTDSERLACGTIGGRLTCWNTRTGEREWEVDNDEFGVHSLAASPDHQTIAVAGFAPRIELRDARTGELIGQMTNVSAPVNTVAFSPRGRWLAAGDRNGRVYLFDVATRQLRKSW